MKNGLAFSRLGSLTSLISSGSTPLGGESVYLQIGPIVFIRSQNVRMNQLDLTDAAFISEEINLGMQRSVVARGDVLLNITGASIGRVALFDSCQRANVNQHVCIIRPRPEFLDSRYLTYFLSSNEVQHNINTRHQHGGTRQALTFSQIAEFEIPLPALPEQKRIAAILDEADAIRRKRQETIRLLQELRSSSFLRLFGDPVANPKKWPDETFNAHIVQIQYGPRFFNQPYTETGPRIVRITDLDHNGGLDFEAMPRMEVSEEDKRNYCLQPGDLVLARSGATVGKTALIEQRAPECIAGAYFIRLRFGNGIHPRYAQMVLSSRSVQAIIANQSRQSAQQNFNGPAIRRLPLPRPPYDLQEKFVQAYDHLTRLLNVAEDHRTVCADLFNVLVQRAFRGEV